MGSKVVAPWLTPYNLRAFVDRYEAGEYLWEIAESVGRSTDCITELFRHAGVKLRPNRRAPGLSKRRLNGVVAPFATPLNLPAIREWRENGWTQLEVAKALGVSHAWVGVVLERAGFSRQRVVRQRPRLLHAHRTRPSTWPIGAVPYGAFRYER